MKKIVLASVFAVGSFLTVNAQNGLQQKTAPATPTPAPSTTNADESKPKNNREKMKNMTPEEKAAMRKERGERMGKAKEKI
ncbi:MAG: hypothetical protein IPL95_09210 [Saprospiraceae bacterium]|nr:hypothetical protein [Saprospiraceae bacterium]